MMLNTVEFEVQLLAKSKMSLASPSYGSAAGLLSTLLNLVSFAVALLSICKVEPIMLLIVGHYQTEMNIIRAHTHSA